MEGRRVSKQNKKYNPLFILFLCLVAAILVLLILSIVLGIRLGSASKKLKAANEHMTVLEQEVTQLQDDLAAARERVPAAVETPDTPDAPDAPPQEPVAGSSWLDLSGHSEVKVAPTELLDGYKTYYTTAGVNLRAGPATSYDRITTVEFGEAVQVAAREGNWSFVKAGRNFGWINSDFLSTTQPTPPSTSTRTEATSGSLRR